MHFNLTGLGQETRTFVTFVLNTSAPRAEWFKARLCQSRLNYQSLYSAGQENKRTGKICQFLPGACSGAQTEFFRSNHSGMSRQRENKWTLHSFTSLATGQGTGFRPGLFFNFLSFPSISRRRIKPCAKGKHPRHGDSLISSQWSVFSGKFLKLQSHPGWRYLQFEELSPGRLLFVKVHKQVWDVNAVGAKICVLRWYEEMMLERDNILLK